MKTLQMSWDDFGNDSLQLVNKIKRMNLTFDGVYGIPRGGLPLAVVLSHHLELPLLVHPTNNSLVCDDISDLGITLSNVKHKLIVTLFSTPWTKVVPHCFLRLKKEKDSWVVFPWESLPNEIIRSGF